MPYSEPYIVLRKIKNENSPILKTWLKENYKMSVEEFLQYCEIRNRDFPFWVDYGLSETSFPFTEDYLEKVRVLFDDCSFEWVDAYLVEDDKAYIELGKLNRIRNKHIYPSRKATIEVIAKPSYKPKRYQDSDKFFERIKEQLGEGKPFSFKKKSYNVTTQILEECIDNLKEFLKDKENLYSLQSIIEDNLGREVFIIDYDIIGEDKLHIKMALSITEEDIEDYQTRQHAYQYELSSKVFDALKSSKWKDSIKFDESLDFKIRPSLDEHFFIMEITLTFVSKPEESINAPSYLYQQRLDIAHQIEEELNNLDYVEEAIFDDCIGLTCQGLYFIVYIKKPYRANSLKLGNFLKRLEESEKYPISSIEKYSEYAVVDYEYVNDRKREIKELDYIGVKIWLI